MPPPVFQLGTVIQTKTEVPARLCTKRGGYRKVNLPIGRYRIIEDSRDENFWHDQDYSDGYTYRMHTLDPTSPLKGKRISIWQNDLIAAPLD